MIFFETAYIQFFWYTVKHLLIAKNLFFANIREFSKARIHISHEYFTLSIHLSENEHYPKMRTHEYISAGKYRNQF
jgi:hypothetical protein